MQTKKMAIAKKILDSLVEKENLKNYAQLAKFLGVAPSTLSTWISRGRVNADMIFRVCKGLRYEFLLTGEGQMLENEGNVNAPGLKVTGSSTSTPPEPPNVTPGPQLLGKVPLISFVQAGGWTEVQDPFQPGYAEKWLDTIKPTGPNAFALRIVGNSMEPKFREGEIILVDPSKRVESGDFCVAKINNDEATFKQFFQDGGKVFLRPLNDAYDPIDVTDRPLIIVGRVMFKFEEV